MGREGVEVTSSMEYYWVQPVQSTPVGAIFYSVPRVALDYLLHLFPEDIS